MPMPFLDTDVQTFEAAFHFNVTTAFALTRAALPHLLDGGNGSVVNITSRTVTLDFFYGLVPQEGQGSGWPGAWRRLRPTPA